VREAFDHRPAGRDRHDAEALALESALEGRAQDLVVLAHADQLRRDLGFVRHSLSW
jgi:hypothetical protein